MVKLLGAAAVTVPRIPLPLPNACLMPSGGPSGSCAGQSCAGNIAPPRAASAKFAVHVMHHFGSTKRREWMKRGDVWPRGGWASSDDWLDESQVSEARPGAIVCC